MPKASNGEPRPAEAIGRAEKVARMQRLIDEARASGISERSMDEIAADARRRFAAGERSSEV